MKVGDLVIINISDLDENDEMIHSGACGLIIEEFEYESTATPPNRIFNVKLLGEERCNYYYESNLGMINESR